MFFQANTGREIHGKAERCAVLLVNLGTPAAPTPVAVRRYLAEFLADPRVIELPRWLWLPLLHGVILPFRSRRSAHAYGKIWTERGSPLAVFTSDLAEKLGRSLGDAVDVAWAMRYGEPSISSVLRRLNAGGTLRRLLVVPMYPQYSSTTTASVFDAIATELSTWRWPPELRFVNDYWHEPTWLDAAAASIDSYWREHGRGDRLLFSFHGIPKRYFLAGDPYFCHCQGSARRIAERLDLQPGDWLLSFQSRVGREEWLKPYTDETVQRLAKEGVRRLDVICPGFAVDCLETLEEIAMQNRDSFLAAGGEVLRYIPALNADQAHVQALSALVHRHGRGWPDVDDGAADHAAARASDIGSAYAAFLVEHPEWRE